jgi:hypothetical protein
MAGDPPLTISVCVIPREGALSLRLRSGQALAFSARVGGDAAGAISLCQGVVNPLAQAFRTPAPSTGSGQALRKLREERGTLCVGEASEIRGLGHPPNRCSKFRYWLVGFLRGTVVFNFPGRAQC